ncbi:glycosyltransferase [Pseudomonas sp. N-137]|uniref:glycosyltransferase family protein n=1 Tax=unclassified Pseudomonas TaxID=196821 RepID=UPI002363E5D5|nr:MULTISPECIES: glycosyltransferase [unclassified Pseudomonas]MDD2031892.1 glycosyltransferase [Pseudomonas sp. 39167]MEA1029001.1 glycosyltransferase [Pseudomonas sp. N-137]
MKILVLSSWPREPDNRLLWEGLAQHADVEVRYVDKAQQRKLGALLDSLDFALYDRVVLDLLFRYVHRHVRRLSRIPGLTFYEEDACQEFMPTSRWRGKFSAFYRRLPHARMIFTGYQVSRQFHEMGVDAKFLVKGYDRSHLYVMDEPRDIELGFIGRLGSNAYKQRREFLTSIESTCGLRLMRTEPGAAYCEALNRIRFFVSADIGFGEYMAKNFEAMACGCLLFAYRQGGGEEEAIGLEDGVNVLLFDDQQTFLKRLEQARNDVQWAADIAARGTKFAREYLSYYNQSDKLYQILSDPMTRSLKQNYFKRVIRAIIGQH